MNLDTILTIPQRKRIMKPHVCVITDTVPFCIVCRSQRRWQSHRSRMYLVDESTRQRTKQNYRTRRMK